MSDHIKIPLNLIEELASGFKLSQPFPFLVIDDFLDHEVAIRLGQEFPVLGDPRLFVYNNPLEVKCALNDWNAFPELTYTLFNYLYSDPILSTLGKLTGERLFMDAGLHGGGWHIHGRGGKLNPHLDYSIHPKLGLQRKLNLIIYLSDDWREEYGGHLGLWSHDGGTFSPGELVYEVAPKFNRALLFDTTFNSWHGISRPVSGPEGFLRKSLAIYYLCNPPQDVPNRLRALYAPTAAQKDDQGILDLIQKRSDLNKSRDVYNFKKAD